MAYLDFSNKRYSKDQLADLRAMMVKLNSSTLVPEEAGSITLDEFREWLEETVQDYVDDNQEDLRGPAGAAGPQGSTGVGISSIENYYAVTSTNTSPTLSEITSSTIPALNSTNKYLWRKEVVNFTNGTSTASIALICVQGDTGSKGDTGNTGPQGPQGPAGSNGTNGVSAYVHIKYAGSVDETTGIPEDEDLTDSPSIYMGVYTGSSPLASDTASDYTWMLIGANAAATYSKDEIDDLLDLKADQSTTYSKSEVDTALGTKANQSTTYLKSEVDTALSGKANTSGTYSGLTVGSAASADLANGVPDYQTPSNITKFGYNTSGMSWDTAWFGGWDNSQAGENRLRAISRDAFVMKRVSGHAYSHLASLYWSSSSGVLRINFGGKCTMWAMFGMTIALRQVYSPIDRYGEVQVGFHTDGSGAFTAGQATVIGNLTNTLGVYIVGKDDLYLTGMGSYGTACITEMLCGDSITTQTLTQNVTMSIVSSLPSGAVEIPTQYHINGYVQGAVFN